MEERDRDTGEWRFTHRGPFSVLKGGKMVGNTKVMKNVANTSVLQWGGRLLCLWEGGEPYEIEPQTLSTVGKYNVVQGQKVLQEEPPTSDTFENYDVVGGPKMLRENDSHGGHQFPADFLDVAAKILKPILYGTYILIIIL